MDMELSPQAGEDDPPPTPPPGDVGLDAISLGPASPTRSAAADDDAAGATLLAPKPDAARGIGAKPAELAAPMTKMLKRAAGFAALGGVLFGYDVGIISGALLQLEDVFELDEIEKEMVVSTMLIGAMIASLTGGFVIDYIGRRKAIIANAVIFVLGAIGLTAANSYTGLLVARVVLGYGVALSAVSECVYISEIAPAARRGELVSLNELGIAIGIFVSYVANYALITTPDGWRIMFGISIVPAAIQGIGMVFLPPSPRWLLLQGRRAEAIVALAAFRTDDDGALAGIEMAGMAGDDPREAGGGGDPSGAPAAVVAEIDEIAAGIATMSGTKTSDLFYNKTLWRAMWIACTLVMFQQFTGQPNVLFYGTTIFRQSGFETDRDASLVNMGLGALKLIATIFALRKVDHLGRRKLLLAGTAIMLVSLLTLASVSAAYPPDVTGNLTDAELAELEDVEDGAGGRRLRLARASLGVGGHYDFTLGGGGGGMMQSAPTFRLGYDDEAGTTLMHIVRRGAGGHKTHHDTEHETVLPPFAKWVTLGTLFSFVVAYAFSYGPVAWLLLSELFPDDIRARAVAIATIFNWSSNLVVSASFLSLIESIGMDGTFFLYASVNVAALAFVYVYIPETKGRSLEEIQQMLVGAAGEGGCCKKQQSSTSTYSRLDKPMMSTSSDA